MALAIVNAELPDDKRMEFRMGVNLGDVIADSDTIYGDGVNIAARLEKLAEPGGVCIGGNVYDQVRGKLPYTYVDLGARTMHNIPEPVRAYRVERASAPHEAVQPDALPLPDKPSIAVLPFQNMSGDRDQDYFSDGITEDIITALSKLHWIFVIARNSTFAYKGKSPDVRAGGARAWRPLRARRQRAQVRRARAHQRAVDRRHDRRPCLGRTLRSCALPTSSSSRTRSPKASSVRSSRNSTQPRTCAFRKRPPKALTPGAA